MKNKELLNKRPDVDDYDFKPFGYIAALETYINNLEATISDTQCCCKLNNKERPTFKEWTELNCYEYEMNMFSWNNRNYDRNEMFEIYQKFA